MNVIKTLLSWLPYTYGSRHKSVQPELSALLKEPWLECMAANPNIKPVLGAARMLDPTSELPDDHLFTALLKTGLIEDMLFLFDTELLEAHLVIKLGRDVCGHEKVVHGGLTSSICDETFGAFVYALKQVERLGPEAAVTANLTINYRKPIPRQSCLLCTVRMVKQEGRKIYLEALVTDGPTRQVLADSTSLFITLRPNSHLVDQPTNGAKAAQSNGKTLGAMQLGPADVRKWETSPSYAALCQSIGL